MKWNHVIWDWNGTIIDDVHLCIDIINGVLAKYDKPQLTLEKYHEVFDFPVKDYYRRIGFDFKDTPFEEIGTEFMQEYWRRWTSCDLHPGVVRLAETIQAHGTGQSIISAAETRLLQAGVEHFKLGHLFDHLIGLNHHYATSKEKLVFDFVTELAIPPAEVLFIGDTLHDSSVAQNAGVECMLFAGGHHPAHKLKKTGARVFDSFGDMERFLFS